MYIHCIYKINLLSLNCNNQIIINIKKITYEKFTKH